MIEKYGVEAESDAEDGESTLICETIQALNKLMISLPVLRKSHHLSAGLAAEAADFT